MLTPSEKKDKWLADRLAYMTGSTAGACAGLSPYDCAAGVALEKVGQRDPAPDSERFFWGHALEPLVLKRAAFKLPGEIASWQMDSEPTLRVHPEHPWMACTVDGMYTTPSGELGVLEAKTVDPWAFYGWDPYPAYYAAQVQWNMDVCGVARSVLCVLVGNFWQFVCFIIEADPVVQAALRSANKRVWDAAKSGDIAQLVDFEHPKTPDALLALYPNGEPVDARQPVQQIDCPKLTSACIELDRIKSEMSALKAERAAIENRLRAELGPVQVAQIGPYRVKWANATTSRLDKKALQAEAPQLVKKHTHQAATRRLTVKNTHTAEP